MDIKNLYFKNFLWKEICLLTGRCKTLCFSKFTVLIIFPITIFLVVFIKSFSYQLSFYIIGFRWAMQQTILISMFLNNYIAFGIQIGYSIKFTVLIIILLGYLSGIVIDISFAG